MGTNYYLKRIPTQEEIQKIHKLLDEGKIESRADYFNYDPEKDCSVQDMISEITKEIHIGKASWGWEFTFKVNKDFYDKSYESVFSFIKDALESGKWKFIDEYGDEETLDNFIDLVNHKKGGLTYKTDPDRYKYYQYVLETDSISEDGSWWVDNEFC